jgi:hypothetical protein
MSLIVFQGSGGDIPHRSSRESRFVLHALILTIALAVAVVSVLA